MKKKQFDMLSKQVKKIDELSEQVKKIDELSEQVKKIDELSEQVKKIDVLSEQFNELSGKVNEMATDMKDMNKKMDEGFEASKERDNQLSIKIDNLLKIHDSDIKQTHDAIREAHDTVKKVIRVKT
ncbi:MAG: hemagglutinin [Clostridia bacterium]|nr:hemagglutinin [Clostridia bacterium]